MASERLLMSFLVNLVFICPGAALAVGIETMRRKGIKSTLKIAEEKIRFLVNIFVCVFDSTSDYGYCHLLP